MSFLADLPSLGNFINFKPSGNYYIPKYVCDHETAPPNGSVKTDETNILIRSLSKKKKLQATPAPQKLPENGKEKGKRPADDFLSTEDNKPTTTNNDIKLIKRPRNGTSATTTTTTSTPPTKEYLESLTKTQLVSMCKQNNLSPTGNKEQLVERILKSNK